MKIEYLLEKYDMLMKVPLIIRNMMLTCPNSVKLESDNRGLFNKKSIITDEDNTKLIITSSSCHIWIESYDDYIIFCNFIRNMDSNNAIIIKSKEFDTIDQILSSAAFFYMIYHLPSRLDTSDIFGEYFNDGRDIYYTTKLLSLKKFDNKIYKKSVKELNKFNDRIKDLPQSTKNKIYDTFEYIILNFPQEYDKKIKYLAKVFNESFNIKIITRNIQNL